jgi:hypothetical protein
MDRDKDYTLLEGVEGDDGWGITTLLYTGAAVLWSSTYCDSYEQVIPLLVEHRIFRNKLMCHDSLPAKEVVCCILHLTTNE